MANRTPLRLARCLLFGLLLAPAACAGLEHPQASARFTPVLAGDAIIAADGYRLPLERWGPRDPDRVVLALHGFAEHAAVFERLGSTLAEDGTAVYAYDQRGFGRTAFRGVWPGTDRLAADARTALALLRARYPAADLHLLGESMGGAVAVVALREHQGRAPSSVMLLAPALWDDEDMPWYQRSALWVGDRLVPGLSMDRSQARTLVGVEPTDDPAVVSALLTDERMLSQIRSDMLVGVADLMDRATEPLEVPANTLLLYGLNDQIVPPRAMCATLAAIEQSTGPSPTVALYPRGYHLLLRDLQADFPLADLRAWLRNGGGPLPASRATPLPEARERVCALR